jgi:uncharacterized membrane protein
LNDVILARALHVLAVIHWIGGLTFVSLVVLPFAKSGSSSEDGGALFEGLERRFSAQVRISVPLAGISGRWMVYRLELWERFVGLESWWMTAMLILWLVFMLMLFVVEPLMHARFEREARHEPMRVLGRLIRLHRALLVLAAITAFGAVSGAHGLVLF